MKQIVLATAMALALSFSVGVVDAENRNTSSKSEGEYSDTWLQTKLLTAYTFNPNLSLFDIDVDVRDQVAVLSGAVGSGAERDLAEQVALSIKGITKVNNQIKIDSAGARNVNRNNSVGQKFDDAANLAAVKAKLLANPNVKGLDINVDSKNGVVTLNGSVTSAAESNLAELIARNTEDVYSVVNNLKVGTR